VGARGAGAANPATGAAPAAAKVVYPSPPSVKPRPTSSTRVPAVLILVMSMVLSTPSVRATTGPDRPAVAVPAAYSDAASRVEVSKVGDTAAAVALGARAA